MSGVLFFFGFIFLGYLYMQFSRFVCYIFMNDFNWKAFKEDWNFDPDDMGFEKVYCMFVWPVAIITWFKDKFNI